MNPLPLVILGASALVMLALIALAFGGPSPERARARRITALKDRHSGVGPVAVEAQLRRITATRQTRMDLAAARFLPNPAALKKRLAMTGKNWTVGRYGLATVLLFVIVAGAIWLRSDNILLALFLGLAVGAGVPHFVVGFHIKRRLNKFTAKFPDAIELLVRGLRSGLPISETFGVVGQEVEGPVGEEFRAITDKMKIGRTMDAALQETADRLGTPEFQFFVITIAIQRETGGNLAETLANLADVLRKRGQMKLKIKAMSSEFKASAYIVGSLPFIVFGLIWWISPNYMANFFSDQRLIVAGMGGLLWMGIGVFIMAKMVSFEILMTPLPHHPTLLGVDVLWVATLLSGVAAFAVLLAIYSVFTVRDPMAKRVKALNDRREQLKAGITASTSKRRAKLVQKNETTDKLRAFLSSLKVLQDSQLKTAQTKLMQAGIRTKDYAVAVIFGRLVAPIVIGGLVIYLVYGSGMMAGWGPLKKYGIVAAALVLSYKGPDIYLSNAITKRSNAIRKGLPDALDLLVICAEAGLTVDAAFNRVAKELGRAYPELGDEFTLTAIELGFLTDRRQAFENLATRVKLDAIKGVTTTMVQTEKYGTPLASALRVLSAEFRNERMMRAEEKAARLPAIMTVPLILFILPTLFIVILGPASCSIADAFSGGIGH